MSQKRPQTRRKPPRRVRVVFRKLGRHQAWGIYWIPPRKGTTPIIEVDPRQGAQQQMDTLIHESLHHVFPDLTEEQVTGAAGDITAILWSVGFRMVHL